MYYCTVYLFIPYFHFFHGFSIDFLNPVFRLSSTFPTNKLQNQDQDLQACFAAVCHSLHSSPPHQTELYSESAILQPLTSSHEQHQYQTLEGSIDPFNRGDSPQDWGHPQNVSQWQKLLTLPLHRTRQLSCL